MGTRPAVAGIALEPHCAPATLSVLPSAGMNCRPLFRLCCDEGAAQQAQNRGIHLKGKYRSCKQVNITKYFSVFAYFRFYA
jgi:hypothetical protein